MTQQMERSGEPADAQSHSHVFLGEGHEANERKTWAVIILCGIMMVVEIVGGGLFGSLALIADGLHMSTHAGAMLIAALAYTYARRHATDNRFVFGTGKLGDLAGFSSAIVLAIIALLIGYEAIQRFMDPVAIAFNEAIPIAVVGLVVNVVSAWLLSGGEHHGHSHGGGGHSHGGGHSQGSRHSDGEQYREAAAEVRAPFRVDAHQHGHGHTHADGHDHDHDHDHDGGHGHAALAHSGDDAHGHTDHDHGDHQYAAHAHDHATHAHSGDDAHARDQAHLHDHDHHGHPTAPTQATTRDNSIRSAYVHVLADAFVSVLAITGLILAKSFGWLWMDPLAGIIGALVIANWSVTLIRDTAGILLDVCPDEATRERVRRTIEIDGDRVVDLHLWRLGPGHLAAVLAIATSKPRDATFYRGRLSSFACLSHITVEVTRPNGS
jgi:cation diffusion facilitator family transporter